MVGASKYFKEKKEEILPTEVLLKFSLFCGVTHYHHGCQY